MCVRRGSKFTSRAHLLPHLEHGKHLQRRRREGKLRFLVVVLQLRLSPGRFSAKWRFSAFQICGDCRPDGIERSSAQSAAAEAAAAGAAGAAHKMYIVCHLFGFYGFSLVFRRVAPAERLLHAVAAVVATLSRYLWLAACHCCSLEHSSSCPLCNPSFFLALPRVFHGQPVLETRDQTRPSVRSALAGHKI